AHVVRLVRGHDGRRTTGRGNRADDLAGHTVTGVGGDRLVVGRGVVAVLQVDAVDAGQVGGADVDRAFGEVLSREGVCGVRTANLTRGDVGVRRGVARVDRRAAG